MKKLLLLLLFVSVLVSCRKDHEHDQQEEVTTIKVAALLSQTGGWSNLGISSKSALDLAVEEINCNFHCAHVPYKIELTVFETQLNPVIAAQTMENIASEGFSFVIGPQSSAELALVKPIADSLGVLVVSQGSTASSLAIPNDMVFRFVPGDQIEGAAIANTMINNGKQALVTVARNDAGNIGLQSSVGANFSNAGGTLVSVGNYDPATTDFSAVLANIKSEIINFQVNYTNAAIAVYLASFDEATLLFNQASSDPILSSVNWYGGDGFVKNQSLLSDPLAAQFALTTNFFCPDFGLPMANESVWSSLLSSISSASGAEADAYTLAAYDAMYVIAKLVEDNNGIPAGGPNLKTAFFNAANGYSGATGMINLNANGDRSNGSFNYWGLDNSTGALQWIVVGHSE